MGQTQDWKTYLADKRNVKINQMKNTASIAELDMIDATVFVKRNQVQSPRLAIEKRDFKSVSEVPTYQPDGVGVVVGALYEGVEVTIPVEGDTALFSKYISGRYVCPGFSATNGAIKIKQFVFDNRYTIDDLKNNIRTCVENLKDSLAEVEVEVNHHHAQFESDLKKVIDERRQELLLKKQKDNAADPWG